MRRVLTFEAISEGPSGGALLQFAIALRQLNLNPEDLVWEPSGPNCALRVQLTVDVEDSRRLRRLTYFMRQIPDVRDVNYQVADLAPAANAPRFGYPSWVSPKIATDSDGI
jgi:hypothetical protein